MMGGNFDGQRRREFNIRIDIPAARAVFDRWPTDILVSPWEVGGQIFYRCAVLDKISYAAQHPLKMAYASYLPLPYDRECWDQTAVMAGVEEPAKWFGLSSRGKVEVDDEGRTEFTSAPNGRIRILQTTPGQRKKPRNISCNSSDRLPKIHDPEITFRQNAPQTTAAAEISAAAVVCPWHHETASFY